MISIRAIFRQRLKNMSRWISIKRWIDEFAEDSKCRLDRFLLFPLTPSDHCKPLSSRVAIFLCNTEKCSFQACTCSKVEVSDYFEVLQVHTQCNLSKSRSRKGFLVCSGSSFLDAHPRRIWQSLITWLVSSQVMPTKCAHFSGLCTVLHQHISNIRITLAGGRSICGM